MDKIFFQKLSENATLPTRGTKESIGLDLYSAHDLVINPGKYQLVKTGLALAVPAGYYGRIAARSGLAVKFGIDTLAGVVDSDYRGELGVVLINHGSQDFIINVGDRIAQLIIEAVAFLEPEWNNDLSDSARGQNGFGSTGK